MRLRRGAGTDGCGGSAREWTGWLRAAAAVLALAAATACTNPVALDDGPAHTVSSGNHTVSSGNLAGR